MPLKLRTVHRIFIYHAWAPGAYFVLQSLMLLAKPRKLPLPFRSFSLTEKDCYEQAAGLLRLQPEQECRQSQGRLKSNPSIPSMVLYGINGLELHPYDRIN